ncbi:enoyl-CoA hydratase/isomerase family protein [Nocardioides marmoriginsengisoli]|uniref:Enoyl-CoA hydratase/isomerase family protein n=1 Tax=Nocardioides marmoriginsengisoli TaxID=661483 RepID=A0A3N0CIN4_9ACTN|nr:enoyl-CoA hydratase/isomerase family protein [Nocardioides marmoriginsengisoli]RNL62803.1 enoyl-CoA hydratase/isomerase family protein [Nocardioides marmoriginsengisoli]
MTGVDSGTPDCLWTVGGGVFDIQVSRAHVRNAFSPTVYDAVKRGVTLAGAREDVRAVVLRGTPGAFGVGGDLSIFLGLLDGGREHFLSNFEANYDEPLPFHAILTCPKPVIAAVDGLCVAGGMLLAACADITIATPGSRFAIPEARVGLADSIAAALLPPIIGQARARYLLLTGAMIDAETAAAWGLVTSVAEDLEAETARIVDELQRAAPRAQSAYKQMLNAGTTIPSARPLMEAAVDGDGHAGLRAFVDKTPPPWLTATETPEHDS